MPDDADALRARSTPSCPSAPATCATSAPTRTIPPRDLERFINVDHHDRVAFVCLLGDEIIAVGRYEGIPAPGRGRSSRPRSRSSSRTPTRAAGSGSILLEHLAAAARENGLRRFVAEVLAENRAMVRVFRDAGYQVSRAFADGVLHLEFAIDPTEQLARGARLPRAARRGAQRAQRCCTRARSR